MENIVTIELFGVTHKLKTDDDVSLSSLTTEFLENEVARIEKEVIGQSTGLNPFIMLLLATLNISNEYIKLKQGHEELAEELSKRYADIVTRLNTERPVSDGKPVGLAITPDMKADTGDPEPDEVSVEPCGESRADEAGGLLEKKGEIWPESDFCQLEDAHPDWEPDESEELCTEPDGMDQDGEEDSEPIELSAAMLVDTPGREAESLSMAPWEEPRADEAGDLLEEKGEIRSEPDLCQLEDAHPDWEPDEPEEFCTEPDGMDQSGEEEPEPIEVSAARPVVPPGREAESLSMAPWEEPRADEAGDLLEEKGEIRLEPDLCQLEDAHPDWEPAEPEELCTEPDGMDQNGEEEPEPIELSAARPVAPPGREAEALFMDLCEEPQADEAGDLLEEKGEIQPEFGLCQLEEAHPDSEPAEPEELCTESDGMEQDGEEEPELIELSAARPVDNSSEEIRADEVPDLEEDLQPTTDSDDQHSLKLPTILESCNPSQVEKPDALRSVPREKPFELPPLSFLNRPEERHAATDMEAFRSKAELLEAKLNDFGVRGEVTGISSGPVITTFEYKPAPGVKISKIVNLTNDLALALSALSIRIVAPIPGRDVIGIEIPHRDREVVSFRDLVESHEFRSLNSSMGLCLGKDIVGTSVVSELNKMPHLLIAGATGTGKSVGLNAMITSLLYKATPEEVKFIMIDPKRIELSFYNGIPHLISPVVTDMKKATNALSWAVREMERRYDLLAENKVRNINQYNRKVAAGENAHKLPFIVIIIDELADLMMTASRDVEVALARLAQMARAAGIHMILATQRPSVDVLTGTIKANFPTRISFQVSSKIDSRTIIDTNGAETLLGNGDMLFVPPGTAKLARIHGAYISEEEVSRVTAFLKEQQEPEYLEEVTEVSEEEKGGDKDEEYDERYDEAVALVTRTRQASISSVQRHLRIGYNRAARIIEMMEVQGIVGPPDGSKGRQVLVQSYDEMEQ